MIPMGPETLAIFPHAIKTLFYNSLQYHSPTIHLWGLGLPKAKIPERQNGRERDFSGSVATLPMLAVFLFSPLCFPKIYAKS